MVCAHPILRNPWKKAKGHGRYRYPPALADLPRSALHGRLREGADIRNKDSFEHEAVLSAVVIPDRPAPGAPCNGCGFCCLAECCPPAILIHRRRRGPCPELTLDAAGTAYRCGLLVRAPGMLRPLVARWIAAGQGCDSDA